MIFVDSSVPLALALAEPYSQKNKGRKVIL